MGIKMIKEIAQIFDRYDSTQLDSFSSLLEYKYGHEAEILYENYEDLNIYDDKSLRQYVQVILQDSLLGQHHLNICEEMIADLRVLLFKR